MINDMGSQSVHPIMKIQPSGERNPCEVVLMTVTQYTDETQLSTTAPTIRTNRMFLRYSVCMLWLNYTTS